MAIVGAGWAGMAAAVDAVQRGHAVTVFEAAPQPGGRARGVPLQLPDGREVTVDNGQHILIGAYTACLRLMRTVGVDPAQALLRRPLALTYPDGGGLALPDWPAPWDAAGGILGARGWSWRDKRALLGAALGWRRSGFQCDAHTSVATLCAGLPPTLMREFIEPLCVSALNTPVDQASGRVFLRVLHDALLGGRGSSHLLLPRVDLGTLFPRAAQHWIEARGARVLTGHPVRTLHWRPPHWVVDEQAFDRVVLATSAPHAAQIVSRSAPAAPVFIADELRRWADQAVALKHQAITTVYAQATPTGPGKRLRRPMLALRHGPRAPAQFVFELDAITATAPPTGLLAFVISTSSDERAALQTDVTAQAQAQLGLAVTPLRTLTDRRATFACTPALVRPARQIAAGLLAAGDYISGPYPATLEGAVRSGLQAAGALGHGRAL